MPGDSRRGRRAKELLFALRYGDTGQSQSKTPHPGTGDSKLMWIRSAIPTGLTEIRRPSRFWKGKMREHERNVLTCQRAIPKSSGRLLTARATGAKSSAEQGMGGGRGDF